MALLSSGCRVTVEGLPNVHSSSTIHNSGKVTLLDGNCTYHVGKIQGICIFYRLQLFHYSTMPLFCILRFTNLVAD